MRSANNVKSDMRNKFLQSLTSAPLNNQNWKMMPKIRLSNPSKEAEMKKRQKMEAKELKSGIARYLLAHISK